MSAHNSDPAPLLGQLRASAEKLKSQAEAIEQERRIPPSVMDDLRVSGLFRSFVPARYGGLESEVLPVLEGLIEIGEACSSTAWVSSIFATHSLIGAWFSEVAQEALWKDSPDTLIGSSLAPVGELESRPGGYSLSGSWSFSSGIDHAEWLLLGAKDEQREAQLVLVRTAGVSIVDDWQVCGLEGTGSKSLTVEGTYVPESFVLSMSDLEAQSTPGHRLNSVRPFHLPWRPAFSFSFVPPAIGAAKAALAASRAYLSARESAYTGTKFRDKPVGWMRLAESAGEIETALTLMRRDVWEMEECLRVQETVPRSLIHRSSYTPALIVELCRRAVTRLFHLGGGRALYRDSSLQRNFRDIQAIGQHPGVNIDIAGESYGRGLLDHQDLSVGQSFPC
jgi:alkylation response protein AidB-like acyl-CoA dehydrogenase